MFNSKEYFDAENCFNTAVSLHPANFKAVYNRGKLRLKIDNTEGAIADLDKATSLKPEHAGAHELFGDALLRVGKEVEAAIQWRICLLYTSGVGTSRIIHNFLFFHLCVPVCPKEKRRGNYYYITLSKALVSPYSNNK